MNKAAALGSRDARDEGTDTSLRESEARFRGTFENAAVGIAHVGVDGRWLRVNDKLCSIVGYDRAELSALTFQDITWHEDLAADIAYVQQMLAGTIHTYSMEKRYVHKDRSRVWINLTVSLERTAAGAPDYFIAVVEDINARKAAEAALRESEARVRALADNMSQLAWTADRHGARTWCNRRWLDYVGDDWRGPWDMLRATPQSRTNEAEFAQRFHAGEAWSDTYGLVGKHGEVRLFLTQIVPLRDERGQILQWFGTHTDVTAELDSRRAQELARFFELALDLACVASVTGQFVHVNPEFKHVLGYSHEELLQIPIMELVHPDDHASTMAELGKLSGGVPMISFTNRYRCKDGRYRWLQWRAAPVVDGLIYALARDVTADREIMEALRLTQERYRLITDNVIDYSFILLDPAGRVITWNAGAERILGYSAAEMVGEHVAKIYPVGDGGMDARTMLDQAAELGRFEHEGERTRKDGSALWVNVVITALRGADGTLQGFAKITRDFTQRHQAEVDLRAHEVSLAASLREREVLLQEVHHRVKNNLQVISSLMNMQLRMVEADTVATRTLEECRSRVEAISLIHEQLYQSQDYTKIPFDQYITNLTRNVFRGTNDALSRIALVLELEPIALPVDRAIPCGLMLNELLTNAVKHAFPNGRSGEVRVGLHARGSEVEVSVADNGVGMPEAKRGDYSSSLGMELVSILVEQLQGELHVNYDEGTSFRVVCTLDTQH